MIKGVNHTIIEVTDPQNRYFERALLFVRPQLTSVGHQHLQRQADHFVQTVGAPPMAEEKRILHYRRKQKRRIINGLWWSAGFAVGATLVWLL